METTKKKENGIVHLENSYSPMNMLQDSTPKLRRSEISNVKFYNEEKVARVEAHQTF